MRRQGGYSIQALARPKKKLRVKEIMTRNVRVFTPDASLADAIFVMNQHRVGSVIVAREGKPVGLLTDGDVLQAIGRRSPLTKSTSVRNLM